VVLKRPYLSGVDISLEKSEYNYISGKNLSNTGAIFRNESGFSAVPLVYPRAFQKAFSVEG